MPLELVTVTLSEFYDNNNIGAAQIATVNVAVSPVEPKRFGFSLQHLGKSGGTIFLEAPNQSIRESWIKAIEAQRKLVTNSKNIFRIIRVTHPHQFDTSETINCYATYHDKMLVGTNAGVWVIKNELFGLREVRGSHPLVKYKLLDLLNVTQIDILSGFGIVLILAGTIKT